MSMIPTERLNWQRLVALEPRLLNLERIVRAGGDWQDYCHWRETLKLLVGRRCQREEISSPDAFEVAHAHLLDVFERGAR